VKYKNLGKALKVAFPEFDWKLGRFSEKGKKSVQRWYLLFYPLPPSLSPSFSSLSSRLATLLVLHTLDLLSSCLHSPSYSPLLIFSGPLPLPFFLLTGEHHYFDLPVRDGPGGTVNVIARDQKKIEQCTKAGITLVHVPYW
jgi:hypothetical protein